MKYYLFNGWIIREDHPNRPLGGIEFDSYEDAFGYRAARKEKIKAEGWKLRGKGFSEAVRINEFFNRMCERRK